MNIACWFSCGAASAVAAKLTLERFSKEHTVYVVNSPVDEEDEDNRRFLKDCQAWLGVEIIYAVKESVGHTSAVKVWEKERFMSSPYGAPCTKILKKEARYEFQIRAKIDKHVLGFTSDEQDRHNRFINTETDQVIPVLIEAGITKKDCFRILKDAGISLPAIYSKGFPNANCIGCVKSSSPRYWNLVRKEYPDVFYARAEQSRRIGCKLVRVHGKRMFLDELPSEVLDLRRKVRLNNDCGVFCSNK